MWHFLFALFLCYTSLMLHYFHIALCLCCNLSMLHVFHVALIPCCVFFYRASLFSCWIHVALFSYCTFLCRTLFVWHFRRTPIFMLHSCVAILCCTLLMLHFLCCTFSLLHSSSVPIFACWTFFGFLHFDLIPVAIVIIIFVGDETEQNKCNRRVT